MKYVIAVFFIFLSKVCFAQEDATIIKRGNEMYSRKAYDSAITEYSKPLSNKKNNYIADFNTGNALQKQKKYDEAITKFDAAVTNTEDKTVQAQAYYNKGVTLTNKKDIKGAIEAFKKSLKLNSYDEQCRQNLQRAINELKQQERQKQEQEKKNPKPNPQKEDDKQKKTEDPKQKQNQQKIEDLLNNLAKDEKKLQQKLQQKNTTVGTEKDW